AVREPEPELEPALTLAVAVVVVDAADPRATEARVLGLRDDERVLDGDPRLVIVAVRDPRLELDLRERALVHAHVERVVVVVAARALAAEPVDELLARERPFHSSS